jgi:thioredoxin-dependent peroxiredoxin
MIVTLFGGTPAVALEPGVQAPEFSVRNQDEKPIKLSELKGKPVIMYFYPKDDTPGCTKEACSFRDEYSKFKKLGAVVLGVSRQDKASKKKFIEKYKIPFDLLIDEDGSLAKAYGISVIPGVGFHMRQSILIGPDGKVVKFYDKVNPDTHTAEVLKDLETLLAKKS